MDYSPPGSSVHGILQARILEWVAISISRGSSQPRDLPNPGTEPTSPAWQVDSLPLSQQESPESSIERIKRELYCRSSSELGKAHFLEDSWSQNATTLTDTYLRNAPGVLGRLEAMSNTWLHSMWPQVAPRK